MTRGAHSTGASGRARWLVPLAAAALLTGCDGGEPPIPVVPLDEDAPEMLPGHPPLTVSRRTLENGLAITDLIEGEGPICPPDATVEVKFVASLEDGTVFDSTEQRRVNLKIPLSRPSTIEGLREGIPGMRVGGTRRIEIPWSLAYGEHGRDPIPPMADLTFEITLVRIIEENPAPPQRKSPQ